MKYTENYGLLKPEGAEFYDVYDQNNNMDIIDSELKTATNIAKGRNQALVYSTYAEMVAELNTLPNSELKVGQNIYIGAVGVPDVWIYGVLEESTEYEYISDEAIIEAVGNNVSLQIGYYQIAFLETQKVDLTTVEDEISEVKEDVAELADSLVGFPDMTNQIHNIANTKSFSWTATEDCWILAIFDTNTTNKNSVVRLNGVGIVSLYNSSTSTTLQMSTIFPCKKGDVISKTENGDSLAGIRAYGMRR